MWFAPYLLRCFRPGEGRGFGLSNRAAETPAFAGARATALTDIQRQCVDAGNQIGTQGFVDGAVAVDAGHWHEDGGADDDIEMRLAAFAPAAVAAMGFAVIDDFQPIRGKSSRQAIFYFIGDRHNGAPLHSGPSTWRNNPYSLASESERPS
jgi:hypothetical protein